MSAPPLMMFICAVAGVTRHACAVVVTRPVRAVIRFASPMPEGANLLERGQDLSEPLMDLGWTLLLDPVASTREQGLRPQGGYGLIHRLERFPVHGEHVDILLGLGSCLPIRLLEQFRGNRPAFAREVQDYIIARCPLLHAIGGIDCKCLRHTAGEKRHPLMVKAKAKGVEVGRWTVGCQRRLQARG